MATEKRLIYMDDTIEKLRAYAERKHEAGYTELANGILKAANYIHDNIVRVDAVEVVHGRWEWLGPNRLVPECMCGTCSVCKVRSKYIVSTDICPNCGAKMDGDGNGN